ncbi:hypothetical protein LINGRAHAP2_LOCUS8731 [Linum grandiflorum]
MGNWRNRPSRRWSYNQDRRPPKSSYYDPAPPYQENVDDGIPRWEKEFCFAVGAVPWSRVVDAQDFSFCQSQILKWDDSAGKEAFHNAKSRYWAHINGLPCDIPRPDPDACIDEIDWNPYIDPELILELEEECFAPVEDENDFQSRKKKTRDLFPDQEEGTQILMEPTRMGEFEGWGDTLVDNSRESNNLNKADNPWEKACNQGDEDPNAGWPVGGDESWGWNPNSAYVSQSNDSPNRGNTWERNRPKADGWGEYADGSWGHNQQQQPSKWNNGWRPREEGSFHASGSQRDRGWRNDSKSWGRNQQWDDDQTRNSSYRKASGGWGTGNKDSWRNEGSHQHTTGYTKSGYEQNEYREGGGHHWRGGKTKKRVSFGY